MRRSGKSVGWGVCFVLALALLGAAPNEGDWKSVEEAIKKGLPKTAIEKLEPILQAALAGKDYPQAIKALGQRIVLEGNIQGNLPEERITRLQKELETAPAEMKPVLEAILANWYWGYFQQNRWRFMQRTQTSAPPGDDFTTWDLPRLFAEIDKQFQTALSHAAVLQKVPIAQYDILLHKGNAPDSYRPTLYDFLVYNALDFYRAGEQAAARPQDAFYVMADSPILASAADFLAWKPESTDSRANALVAIGLFQDLLRFHQNDDDPSARLDADLTRLEYAYNTAAGPEKAARYKAALQRFDQQNADHEISTRALHNLATVLHGEQELVEARKVALQAVARFPNSVGGRRAYNLIQQIEARESSVTTERVWNRPLPTIDVSYRNVTKAYFRLVKFDFDQTLSRKRYRPEDLNDAERKALLGQKPQLAWSADLPPTEDYLTRTEELKAPDDVPPGSYYLISSHNPEFSAAANQVTFAEVWVSDLALVVRAHQGQGVLDGFVLNAISGEPLSKAKVRAWVYNNNGGWTPIAPVETNDLGLFRLAQSPQNAVLLHAQHGEHALSSANHFYVGGVGQPAKPYEQTLFFTDRSLYRPGQTVHYKGICMSVDTTGNNYQTLSARSVTVVFLDVNGKEIERRTHRSNDVGSFSGSFTAPRDRLAGRMTIRIDGAPRGQTQVSVEEYKRPKFQVALDAPKEAARLNGTVQLVGHATSYTGAAIDHAQVRYRVVREIRYPGWWYWRCWWMPVQSNSQEIAHGTATTEADGSFNIKFAAAPDPAANPEGEPTFQFNVHADVVDTTGETRSAQRSLRLGFTALEANLTTESWLTVEKPVDIKVQTTTLDGVAQQASGTLKVYSLKQPEQVGRGRLGGGIRPFGRRGPRAAVNKTAEPEADPGNPNSWPLDEMVFETKVQTNAEGQATASAKLKVGIYRAKLETQDRFGKPVSAQVQFTVLDPAAGKLAIKLPNLFEAPQWSLEPGEEFTALWGSGYDTARAYVEIEHRRRIVKSYWTELGATQLVIKQPVSEAMRGGFTVRVTLVRENRAYLNSRRIEVPWSNKDLKLKWEHFVSKLEPAQQETWTLIIERAQAASGAKSQAPPLSELVAAMYDASLDAYLPHAWTNAFRVFYQDQSSVYSQFENQMKYFQGIHSGWSISQKDGSLTYRTFPPEWMQTYWARPMAAFGGRGNRMDAAGAPGELQMDSLRKSEGGESLEQAKRANANGLAERESDKDRQQSGQSAGPDLGKVSARSNLNETAFFFPHLISDNKGTVKFQFSMPEALTEWKFQGFAHNASLSSGLLTDKVVTAKDLMIQPNPPRFVREGDVLEFTVKVSNQSATQQTGAVRLSLADARTGDSVDAQLGLSRLDQEFSIPSKESKSFSWRLTIPDGLGFLTYKAVGSTGRLSDGEEGFLPVLSRRILVTESLPLPIRGPGIKKFDFSKLAASGQSKTLKHQSLNVQMVSNPSWYAVMALPYLMEFPHECSEQVFNRLYANSLARHIAGSDPRIRQVFNTWKAVGGNTLDSPLEKNQELKAVMLEESPWYRQAKRESQARRDVGILFDDNRLNQETGRLQGKLAEMQLGDGRWPWFPGGPPNDYITLYITTGFGRLRHLGVQLDTAPAVKSLTRLDAWADKMYRDILKHGRKDENHLGSTICLYLYGRSFFLEDKPVDQQHKEAVDYWLGQARKHWLQVGNRQSQAHAALALKRFGDLPSAQGIVNSLRERSVSNEEMGMFWRDEEYSWWWYRAPIETQAMMIEAFDEVAQDQKAVEDCQVWLLKQKQTQDWKTTKATADAVYALLLRGTSQLASTQLVEVTLGGSKLVPEQIEAGTGFVEHRFVGPEIKAQLAQVTLEKKDQGVAWGSVHWQYLEDMSQVTPHDGTPLKLEKRLFVKRHSAKGPTLEPVQGTVQVGDELVCRVVLRTDRDMEYVHLKDYRGSGTEPVNVLSQYKFQDGLYYYESTRDTASHFFIDYLPKGVYVFEYSVRVQHKGEYQTGIANIQCMYAPEFNSHSESIALKVE